ncbi:hypothetical protein MKK84_19065 [Methylobacterium sp. E-065]|uniref:hypothetical protein n=1 Tax=Methylobacterium sp. E-065 TaxID=2836583 RepID=UPI001FBA1F42|nr:hypothetical protein [Methylobacterium sp. E-065]MCJ2019509.1 hypothetical protein [Methylobacterium sp. E-065]
MQRTHFSTHRSTGEGELLIELITGAPGGGKTTEILVEMAACPAPYILAAPRIALIDEHDARLREMFTDTPVIEPIHSRQGIPGSIDRRLRDALDRATNPHTVIITTHAAMMGLEPGTIAGWNVRWDENPDAALVSGVVGLGASWRTMAALYDLMPGAEPGWFRVIRRPDVQPVTLSQHLNDVGKQLVELHRLAGSSVRIVEVDVESWEDAGVPRRKVRWRSIWSFAALAGCASLRVAAAGYSGSLTDHAVRRAGGVRVEETRLDYHRTAQPAIKIHWFARHPGSTGWWATAVGKRCLVAVSRHLEAIGFDGYWASNSAIENFFVGRFDRAEKCRPKLAGTNSLRHHTSAALIYSAKATPDDAAIITALGLDAATITSSREDEDVFQFIFRGAVRERDYTGPYDIYLYDLGQAERLRDRLLGAGLVDVTLDAVSDAGIIDVVRTTRVRRAKVIAEITPETAADRRERRRAKDTERKRRKRAEAKRVQQLSGDLPTRGRPKGSRRPA